MERFKHTANLLTVVQTCRRQGRSVIDFFEQAIKAMVHGVTTPSKRPYHKGHSPQTPLKKW